MKRTTWWKKVTNYHFIWVMNCAFIMCLQWEEWNECFCLILIMFFFSTTGKTTLAFCRRQGRGLHIYIYSSYMLIFFCFRWQHCQVKCHCSLISGASKTLCFFRDNPTIRSMFACWMLYILFCGCNPTMLFCADLLVCVVYTIFWAGSVCNAFRHIICVHKHVFILG